MGKIIAYCKENCPYSENTKNILNKLQLNNPKANITIYSITDYDKENVKQQLRPVIGDYRTFPIILYEKSKTRKQFFVGGDSKLKEIIGFVSNLGLSSSENLQMVRSQCQNLKEGECYLMGKLIHLMEKNI